MKKIFLSLSFLISATSFASDLNRIIPKADQGRGWFVPQALRVCLEKINTQGDYKEWKNIEIDRDTWAQALIDAHSYVGGRNDQFGKEALTKLLFFGGKKEFELKEEEKEKVSVNSLNQESLSHYEEAKNKLEEALTNFDTELQSRATLLTAEQKCAQRGQIFELLKLQEMVKAIKEIQNQFKIASEKGDEIAQTFAPNGE